MKNTICILLLSLILLSCSSNYVARYNYTAETVSSEEAVHEFRDALFGRYQHLYVDNNIELLFDINPHEIGIHVKNPSWDTLRIIWDKVSFSMDIDSVQNYELKHTNFSQEKISLEDTTQHNYEALKLIVDLRKQDTTYIQSPTVILPGFTITDVLLSNSQDFFMPYEMRDENKLSEAASIIQDKYAILNFPYLINSKQVNLKLKLKVNYFQVLKHG
jgi:hypothetical protein